MIHGSPWHQLRGLSYKLLGMLEWCFPCGDLGADGRWISLDLLGSAWISWPWKVESGRSLALALSIFVSLAGRQQWVAKPSVHHQDHGIHGIPIWQNSKVTNIWTTSSVSGSLRCREDQKLAGSEDSEAEPHWTSVLRRYWTGLHAYRLSGAPSWGPPSCFGQRLFLEVSTVIIIIITYQLSGMEV